MSEQEIRWTDEETGIMYIIREDALFLPNGYGWSPIRTKHSPALARHIRRLF